MQNHSTIQLNLNTSNCIGTTTTVGKEDANEREKNKRKNHVKILVQVAFWWDFNIVTQSLLTMTGTTTVCVNVTNLKNIQTKSEIKIQEAHLNLFRLIGIVHNNKSNIINQVTWFLCCFCLQWTLFAASLHFLRIEFAMTCDFRSAHLYAKLNCGLF